MKIARATPEDINALCDLAFALDAINAGSIPPAATAARIGLPL